MRHTGRFNRAIIAKRVYFEKPQIHFSYNLGRKVKMFAGFGRPDVPQTIFEVVGVELMESERINGKLVYTRKFLFRCKIFLKNLDIIRENDYFAKLYQFF